MSNKNSHLKKIKGDAQRNLEEGKEFLLRNAERDAVVQTASGLQYEVLVEGNGAIPKLSAEVLCHYKGELLNGEVFDSSYKRKRPASFPIKDLIKGWQEALVMMPVGSTWRLYVPYNLGYGFQSLTDTSGGNCTLIFDIELIAIL